MKKNIFLLIVFTVSIFYAQVKDKSFIQEYHKPYQLRTDLQNNVKAIIVDEFDMVWAGTKAGLFKLDNKRKEWMAILDSSNQGPINDLFIDSEGNKVGLYGDA